MHTVERESTKEGDLFEAIRLLTLGQEKLQNQMSECLTNFSQVTDRKYQGRTYITKFNGDQKERKYCLLHDSDSHELQDCMTFKQWTAENQMDFLKQNRICYACFKRGHVARDSEKKFACRVKVNGNVCGRPHHSILHSIFTSAAYAPVIDVTSNHLNQKGAFLMSGFVDSGNNSVPTLYDAEVTSVLSLLEWLRN